MKRGLWIFAAIWGLFLSTMATGGTMYVDPALGNNAWDGSALTYLGGSQGPKKTVQAAIEGLPAEPGTVILWRPRPSRGRAITTSTSTSRSRCGARTRTIRR